LDWERAADRFNAVVEPQHIFQKKGGRRIASKRTHAEWANWRRSVDPRLIISCSEAASGAVLEFPNRRFKTLSVLTQRRTALFNTLFQLRLISRYRSRLNGIPAMKIA
jgi:hypothetical protein